MAPGYEDTGDTDSALREPTVQPWEQVQLTSIGRSLVVQHVKDPALLQQLGCRLQLPCGFNLWPGELELAHAAGMATTTTKNQG